MKEWKNFCALALVAGLMAGCATAPDAAVKKDLTEPEMVQVKDPNPYANYGDATKSTPGLPMAYEWQKSHDAEIAAATKPETLAAFVKDGAAAAGLLAEVKEAFASDPKVLVQIAAVSQLVMCPKCDKAPAAREVWTKALLEAAAKAPDTYRTLFYLDQLRWCGKAGQADEIVRIGAKAGDKAVADFANVVVRELKAAK